MANNLTAVIGADTSGFRKQVEEAKNILSAYTAESKRAKLEIEKNTSVTSELVAAYNRVVKVLDKIQSGTMSTVQAEKALASLVKELKVQWSNLTDDAKASSFGKSLGTSLSTAENQLQQLSALIKQANKEMGGFGGNTELPVKKQFKLLTMQMTELTAQYRAMSDVEKASAAGQELAQHISEIRNEAGSLKDTIGDVQLEISAMASDTPNLDVFNEAIGIGADALSTYSAIIAKVTGDEKALKDMIATVTMVQSAANLATKVTNALQSSSVIMLKLRKVQEAALAAGIALRTAAEGKGTIATKAATAAQAAFNLVAKANPYVLLATVILGAGAALYAFCKKSEEATEAEEKAQRKAEELKKKQEELRKKTEECSTAAGTAEAKFLLLAEQWKQLKSVAEKNKFLKDNQSAFDALGISVYNVKTAEDVFVNNTDAVVNAIIARAVAAKKAEQAAEDIIALQKKRDQKSVATGDYYVKANDSNLTADERKKHNIPEYDYDVDGYYAQAHKATQLELDRVNKERQAAALQRQRARKAEIDKEQLAIVDGVKEAVKAQNAAESQLAKLGDNPGSNPYKHGGSGSGNGKSTGSGTDDDVKKVDYLEGSVNALKAELSKIKKDYADGVLNILPEDYKKQVADLEKTIDDLEIAKGIKIPAEIKPIVNEEDIEKIAKKQTKFNVQLATKQHDDVMAPDQSKVLKSINDADNLKMQLDFYKEMTEELAKQYQLIKAKLGAGTQLTKEEDQLISKYDEATKQVNTLAEAYDKAAKKAEILVTKSNFKKARTEAFTETVGALGDVNRAVSSTVKGWLDLGESWEDMSAFEKVTSSIDNTIGTIESLIGIVQTVQTVFETFSAFSTAMHQKKLAENTTEQTSNMATVGTNSAVAISEATASGASMPFPANIAAIAAGVAAVIAAIAMIGSFADGGIIGGATSIGDYNIARVNAGEMILNGTLQKHLFNLINGGGTITSAAPNQKVDFRIKGNALKGVLRNVDKKKAKI